MSRIGKLPVVMPQGVQVSLEGSKFTVTGPKGELSRVFDAVINIREQDGSIIVERKNDEKYARSMHGLTRTLVNNMVIGVTEGYQKTLDIVGVGYRVAQEGSNLTFQVGLSHPVEVAPPPGIELQADGQTRLHVKGMEKELVGQIAAKIRKIRPPDRYKGKGIRYAGEDVKLKPGKGLKAA